MWDRLSVSFLFLASAVDYIFNDAPCCFIADDVIVPWLYNEEGEVS
jgi:hypothetical protein